MVFHQAIDVNDGVESPVRVSQTLEEEEPILIR
jgi:hypothetical protein